MLIRRIAVRNFRKLLHGVEIDGMEPGLTVIVGDNEEGKSTLLKALQSAFFDRYKLTGDAADAMKPFGSEVRPEVEVDFEVGQTSYRMKKGFLQSSSASLESNGDRWQNDSAEDRLRDLLGFSSPGRGAAKEEHRGLSGLLWVEQGRAFEPLELNRDTRDALHEAIEGEVGQVTGGERGRKLLAAVQKNYDEYYTKKAGREKEVLKKARAEVESSTDEVESLENEVKQYDDKVNKLEKLKSILTQYERDGQPAQADAERQQAQAAVRELEALEENIHTAAADLKAAQKTFELARSTLSDRKNKAKMLQEGEKEAKRAIKEVDKLDEDLRLATQARSQAEEQRKTARTAFEEAKSKRVTAQRGRERAEITVEMARLMNALNRAQDIETEIEQKQEAAAQIRIDETELNTLKKKEAELVQQQAALEAVATILDFSPSDAQLVTVDGKKLPVDKQHRIIERTTLELEGFGTLEIIPGGEDIRTRRSTVDDLRSGLKANLERIGHVSIGEADAAYREKNATLADIEKAKAELHGTAPEGIERLRSEVAARRKELAAVVGATTLPAPSVETAKEMETAALSHETDTNRAYIVADEAFRMEERNVYKIRECLTGQKGALDQRRMQTERLQIELDRERQNKTDANLEEDSATAEQKMRQCGVTLKELEDRRERMSPDAVRRERDRAQDVYRELKERIDKDQREARDLEVELRTIGKKGLGEEIEQKRGEREAATQKLKRLELDAKAWKLLRDTLQQAEREAKEVFLAPVTERLQPYMNLVFPDTKLQLDDEGMEIAALRRTHDEPFASLSIGTREQIAVLARLALADLLREKGKPVVLILDDALVNCDDGRFNRMALALRKAAENVQIIILTCHEARYRSLGATMVRLMDCKADVTA